MEEPIDLISKERNGEKAEIVKIVYFSTTQMMCMLYNLKCHIWIFKWYISTGSNTSLLVTWLHYRGINIFLHSKGICLWSWLGYVGASMGLWHTVTMIYLLLGHITAYRGQSVPPVLKTLRDSQVGNLHLQTTNKQE